MIKHVVSCLLLSTALGSAYAGDMGEINQPYDFNGFYAGLETGFGTFFTKDNHSQTFSTSGIQHSSILRDTNTAIAFEGNLGFGRMILANTYLGAKASIYYTPLETLTQSTRNTAHLISVNNSNRTTVKPIYNIDGVLGYEIVPHLLPFVEAGVSFANVNSIDTQHKMSQDLVSGTVTSFTNSLNTSGYKTGYNVGVGTNYQLNRNWYLSSELIYTYLGKNSATSTVAVPVSAGTETISSTRTHQLASLLVGVSYLVPNS